MLSLLAFVPAALALVLGFIARREEPVRGMGTAAVIVAALSTLYATAMLFVLFDDSFGY